jgi:transposase
VSTSLLYHSFGMAGYTHTRTFYEEGEVIFRVMRSEEAWRCSVCDGGDLVRRGRIWRRWKTLPIGRKPVWIECDVPRLFCRDCGEIRQAKTDFAEPKKRHTKAFARFALELAQISTLQDAATFLGVSWDTIKDIQKADLQKRYKRIKLRDLQWIGIDEICIGRGHRYVTLVLDLKSGAVVYVGEGKGQESLDPFWKQLARSGAKIQAVAIDMSKAYYRAVTDNLPQAKIVFDHFHIIKLMNEKLSQLRRELYHHITDVRKQNVLKGSRWLLLKDPKNLDDDEDEKGRLQRALELNKPLATAYYLKEDLRRLWRKRDKEAAGLFLKRWCQRAEASGIPILVKFAHLLLGYRSAILAWYDFPISNGPLEGTNNKIKTMQRMAYGYRDREFFMLKIYALHECKYAFVG